jgi:ribonuclease P protein component
MRFTYPKSEKLKSKKTIDLLFSKGKSVSKFPLRLVYVSLEEENDAKTTVGVSVSKKHFKHAVDRNYYKRILREAYRLNKHLLLNSIQKPYGFMLFYQTTDRLSSQEIHQKTIQLFEKFVLQIQSKE